MINSPKINRRPQESRSGLAAWRLPVILICLLMLGGYTMAGSSFISPEQSSELVEDLVQLHGENHRAAITRGISQVSQMWRESDGNSGAFGTFCRDNYIADPEIRRETATRFENALESIYGYFSEMRRDLGWNFTIETGPILPIDYAFASFSPGAHLSEDLFQSRIAMIALLNYPLYNLEDRLALGGDWSRTQWADARLAESFQSRIPSDVAQHNSVVLTAVGNYISNYNIWMHHLLTDDGKRPFPEGMKLITHWNLRDELKSLYAEPDGLPRQKMIYDVMLHIIRQDIPQVVINNPGVDWNPMTNQVSASFVVDGPLPEGWSADEASVTNEREPDTRYVHLLNIFRAQSMADPYFPTMPTMIQRRFEMNREMPEKEVKQILESVVGAPVMKDIANLIKKRLGRDLLPYDIWYDGFKARSNISEDKLDSIVGAKYPTVEAFENDIPIILGKLGFSDETAQFLREHIEVDPSRGAGHARGPGHRQDKARLRTRIPEGGMNYKGYNIAVHELGHNVEQVLSLYKTDHTLLRGVPNTAFTEGFAFVFQARDLELLGVSTDDPNLEHLRVLDVIWGTSEIGAVGLVDMAVWNWMYTHSEATPAQLKEAVIAISRDVWNQFFAPIFGIKDSEILAVYSHMISSALYLPDYSIGHIISFQVENHMKGKNLATEMERMCVMGSVTPDLWMKNAVGAPISAQPMIRAAEAAVKALDR